MTPFVGRYAPSPTGDLHFGSLIAAVASFCHVRARGGLWKLRIDDLDSPRVVPGSAERILGTLARFGLDHDGPVLYQSTRGEAYAAAIERLRRDGHAFACGCTRREAQQGPIGAEGPIYPGTCRGGMPAGREERSIRCRVGSAVETVVDGVQGRVRQDLAADVGDFVIRRADGITAYQLATVVDDAEQGVTEVVRGADLLGSTPRQRLLQRQLGYALPACWHVPIAVDANGEKLGKSNGALAVETQRGPVSARLYEALVWLGQDMAATDAAMSPQSLLEHAVTHWCTAAVPAVLKQPRQGLRLQ